MTVAAVVDLMRRLRESEEKAKTSTAEAKTSKEKTKKYKKKYSEMKKKLEETEGLLQEAVSDLGKAEEKNEQAKETIEDLEDAYIQQKRDQDDAVPFVDLGEEEKETDRHDDDMTSTSTDDEA